MDTQRDTTRTPDQERFRAEGPAYNGPRQERSVGALLRDFSREIGHFVRQEISLARAEMNEKIGLMGRNAAYLAVGGAFVFAGVLVLLAAACWGLAAWMSYMGVSPGVYTWLSPLIIGAIVLAIGAGLVAKSLSTIKNAGLAPKRTAQSLRDTRDWVKEKVS